MAVGEAQETSGHVRVTYQVPKTISQSYARSFEEAFVYADAAWLTANKTKMLTTGETFTHAGAVALTTGTHNVSLPKVDSALDLLANEGWAIPIYICRELEWLAKQ